MRLRTHPDGSVWTKCGRLLWYYPAKVEQQSTSHWPLDGDCQVDEVCVDGVCVKTGQQSDPPISEVVHEWDKHSGKYTRVSRFKVQQEQVPVVNAVSKDFDYSSKTRFRLLDASTQWVDFGEVQLHKDDVLQHANNNCIEILDSGARVGAGVRYKFVAKPTVHTKALRAGEEWWLINTRQ